MRRCNVYDFLEEDIGLEIDKWQKLSHLDVNLYFTSWIQMCGDELLSK